jgi:hypothetical protein
VVPAVPAGAAATTTVTSAGSVSDTPAPISSSPVASTAYGAVGTAASSAGPATSSPSPVSTGPLGADGEPADATLVPLPLRDPPPPLALRAVRRSADEDRELRDALYALAS